MKLINLFSVIVLASVGTVWAQEPQATSTSSCPYPMMGRGANRMEWHQKAIEKFKAQNEELEHLVAAMNSAKGPAKIDAMAAVINKAMEQRKAWLADMEGNQKKMMEWMKTHPAESGGTTALPSPAAKP
jgi:hypothetical protein